MSRVVSPRAVNGRADETPHGAAAIRILQIIPTLVRGGAEKQLTLLCQGLPRDRFDVHVGVLTKTGPLEADLRDASIPIELIGKRWKVDPAAYFRLKRLVKKLQPDLVHTWIFAANAYGRQAAFAAGVPRVIAGERCVDLWKRWHEFWIDRHLARRTTRIATNSTGVRDFYAARGIDADKFVIIPNGIGPPRPADPQQAAEVRARYGIPETAQLAVAVGRLWPQKRYKDLIWAAELLRAGRGESHFLIVGEGPQRWRLERFAQQAGVAEFVHFAGHLNDVWPCLQAADCFWLGSGYEGQSNALMEAMTAGLPVVASDIPGNRDLVVDGQTGFLVPVGDRAAFARKTFQLFEDGERARRMGAAGRERMQTEFTIDRMVTRYADLYESLMA